MLIRVCVRACVCVCVCVYARVCVFVSEDKRAAYGLYVFMCIHSYISHYMCVVCIKRVYTQFCTVV